MDNVEDTEHAAQVDAWLERAGKGLSPGRRVELFERALGAMWDGTRLTLGEVTLSAVADRVLYVAAERFAFLSGLTIDADGRVSGHDLLEQVDSLSATELTAGFRFMLVEFLTVIGHLTAELLTAELHAALAKVVLPKVEKEHD